MDFDPITLINLGMKFIEGLSQFLLKQPSLNIESMCEQISFKIRQIAEDKHELKQLKLYIKQQEKIDQLRQEQLLKQQQRKEKQSRRKKAKYYLQKYSESKFQSQFQSKQASNRGSGDTSQTGSKSISRQLSKFLSRQESRKTSREGSPRINRQRNKFKGSNLEKLLKDVPSKYQSRSGSRQGSNLQSQQQSTQQSRVGSPQDLKRGSSGNQGSSQSSDTFQDHQIQDHKPIQVSQQESNQSSNSQLVNQQIEFDDDLKFYKLDYTIQNTRITKLEKYKLKLEKMDDPQVEQESENSYHDPSDSDDSEDENPHQINNTLNPQELYNIFPKLLQNKNDLFTALLQNKTKEEQISTQNEVNQTKKLLLIAAAQQLQRQKNLLGSSIEEQRLQEIIKSNIAFMDADQDFNQKNNNIEKQMDDILQKIVQQQKDKLEDIRKVDYKKLLEEFQGQLLLKGFNVLVNIENFKNQIILKQFQDQQNLIHFNKQNVVFKTQEQIPKLSIQQKRQKQLSIQENDLQNDRLTQIGNFANLINIKQNQEKLQLIENQRLKKIEESIKEQESHASSIQEAIPKKRYTFMMRKQSIGIKKKLQKVKIEKQFEKFDQDKETFNQFYLQYQLQKEGKQIKIKKNKLIKINFSYKEKNVQMEKTDETQEVLALTVQNINDQDYIQRNYMIDSRKFMQDIEDSNFKKRLEVLQKKQSQINKYSFSKKNTQEKSSSQITINSKKQIEKNLIHYDILYSSYPNNSRIFSFKQQKKLKYMVSSLPNIDEQDQEEDEEQIIYDPEITRMENYNILMSRENYDPIEDKRQRSLETKSWIRKKQRSNTYLSLDKLPYSINVSQIQLLNSSLTQGRQSGIEQVFEDKLDTHLVRIDQVQRERQKKLEVHWNSLQNQIQLSKQFFAMHNIREKVQETKIILPLLDQKEKYPAYVSKLKINKKQ